MLANNEKQDFQNRNFICVCFLVDILGDYVRSNGDGDDVILCVYRGGGIHDMSKTVDS